MTKSGKMVHDGPKIFATVRTMFLLGTTLGIYKKPNTETKSD